MELNTAGLEIERPLSIVSMESMTTMTSINDFDDSLSSITTPRGTPRSASPNHTERPVSDAPPSYDESQASQQHNDTVRSWQYQGEPFRSPSDITVYRSETPQRLFYPTLNGSTATFSTTYGVNDHFTTRDGCDELADDQPRSSALLYHALKFTSSPVPAAAANGQSAPPLSRPVAIPSLRNGPHSTNSPIQFARLYARILQTTSISPAQFAQFVDGLNAICVASSITSSSLNDPTTFQATSDHASTDLPKSQWLPAYMDLSSSKFFQPRGLQVQILSLSQLADLAKLPAARGYRNDLCRQASRCPDLAADASNEQSLEIAKASAMVLNPFIEPLIAMIPAVHRDSEAMNQIAHGLANFSVQEKGNNQSVNVHRSNSEGQLQVSDMASVNSSSKSRSKFLPSIIANIPLPLGPILPGKLPPSSIRSTADRRPSWQEWGEDFGKRMELWGSGYGKRWEEWGMDYGRQWQKWSKEVTAKSVGRHGNGSSPQVMMALDSMPAQAPVDPSSSAVHVGAEEENWNDGASVSSDSSSSSDDSDLTAVEDDPELIFAKKVAKIEDMAAKARAQGKKDAAVIEQERAEALEKAADDKTKREHRMEYRMRRKELKHHARIYKRQMMHWKRAYKHDIKSAKRHHLPSSELQAIKAQRMAEMAQMQCRWEEVRAEIEQMKFDLRTAWRQTRAEHKAQRATRVARMQPGCHARPHARSHVGRHAGRGHSHPHMAPPPHAGQIGHSHGDTPVFEPFQQRHMGPGLHFGRRGGPYGWHQGGWRGGRGRLWGGGWHHQHQHPHHYLHQHHPGHGHGPPEVWPHIADDTLDQDDGVDTPRQSSDNLDEGASDMFWIVISSLQEQAA